MNEKQAFRAVAALATERPQWVPVLEAVLRVAERTEPYGGEFAGAWVLDELSNRSGHATWLPNLRVLVSYGFVEKAGDSARGGRRAYYRCPGAKAIARALSRVAPAAEAQQEPPDGKPSRFRFIGSGSSGEPGADTGRRAGEFVYQPRSWR
jgi:hypothetical protein